MIKLTIRQLEYVDALAQTRHFGRAAELAGVTQPALSSQIAELEDRLGCRLFVRGGRRVELTEEARVLLPRIDRALQEIRAIETIAAGGRSAMEGRLKVGVIPTLAPYMLPRVLPELRALFPALVLELREAVTQTLIEETVAGRLDAALVALPVEQPGLVVEPLFEDRFLLALPASEPGFVEPPVPPESPVLERLMLLEEGHCMRDQALAVCGSVRPSAMANYGATSLTTLLQMVAHGLGVTLLPQVAEPAAREMRDVRIVPFAQPEPFRTIGLAWRRGGARRAECAMLGDTLRRIYRADLPSGGGEVDGKQHPHERQDQIAEGKGGATVA